MDSKNILFAPTNRDFLLSIGAFFLIAFLLGGVFLLKSFFAIKEQFLRKIVQGSVGILAALAPLYFNSITPLLFASILFFVISLIFIKERESSSFFSVFKGKKMYEGIAYFSFAYFILLVLFYQNDRHIITISVSLLAVSETFASIFSEQQRESKWLLFKNKKTATVIIYAIIYLIFSYTLLYIFLYFKFFNVPYFLLSASLLITFSLIIAILGFQKIFWILISSSIFIYILEIITLVEIRQIIIGMFFAFLIVYFSYKAKFLSYSGSLMTFLLATIVFGLGGWKFTIPILTFFILSSLLSKTGKEAKQKFKNTFEKSGIRDHAQVLANGGIPGILVIINFIWPNEHFYFLYLLSLAVATGDTWSTELGVLSKTKPRLLTTFKKVDPGVSGAISLLGTIGGLIGASLIFLSGIFFTHFSLSMFFELLFLALLGDFFDSFIGATLQGQYQCIVCNKYTEKKIHCSKPTNLIQGFRKINNDTVNLSSNLIVLLIFIFILLV